MIHRVAMALGGLTLAGATLMTEARFAVAQDAPPGDPARGATSMGQCRTCHGADGIARFIGAPNIGGEPAAYLARQLQEYRDGTRRNEMMSLIAAGLSDAAIADLAAYYAAQPVTATLTADAGDAPELCVSCHGADGVSVAEDAPHLAGDPAMYTEAQLEAFRDGTRASEIMQGIAADLGDEEIAAFAAWYAGIEVTAE